MIYSEVYFLIYYSSGQYPGGCVFELTHGIELS